MRITLTYVILELLKRYGAIPIFIALVIASVLALTFISKVPGRSHAHMILGLGIFLCSTALAFGVASAAWSSGIQILQVFRGTLSIPPRISGSFSVAEASISLASPPNGELEGKPIFAHFFYPAKADPERSSSNEQQDFCERIDRLSFAPTERPYPLVLLAPGLGGAASSMSDLARNLASHGYVVAGVDDLARDAPSKHASAADEDIRLRPFDFSSAEGLKATMSRSGVRVKRVASRALAVLDRLEACMAHSSTLRDHVELTRVGFVGFSFGGSAAVESSFMDRRIAAVVNLDGSLFGRAADNAVKVPYLMMHSDFSRQVLYDPTSPHLYDFLLDQNDLRLVAVQTTFPDSHLFVIRNSFHGSFADPVPELQNLLKWLLLNPYRSRAIIDAYLTGFLDAYLKDDRRALLGTNDPRYQEVRALNSPD
jgi:dienelactone hydrolase